MVEGGWGEEGEGETGEWRRGGRGVVQGEVGCVANVLSCERDGWT